MLNYVSETGPGGKTSHPFVKLVPAKSQLIHTALAALNYLLYYCILK